MAFVNPRVYGNLCARCWDKRGHSPGRAGSQKHFAGALPQGDALDGGRGWDAPPAPGPPRARQPALPWGTLLAYPWGGTKAGARQACPQPLQAVCAQGRQGSAGKPWHWRNPPAWVGTCCGLEPAGSHGWPCLGTVPGTKPAQADRGKHAACTGSRISRHKTQALKSTRTRVRPSQTGDGNARGVCRYAHTHGTPGLSTRQAGMPKHHPHPTPSHVPLHPVAPARVCGALGVPASPAKLGVAVSSMGTAQRCCLPQSRAGRRGALPPGRGVVGQGWGPARPGSPGTREEGGPSVVLRGSRMDQSPLQLLLERVTSGDIGAAPVRLL